MRPNLVAGEWLPSDRAEAVVDPWHRELLDEVALATPSQLEVALVGADRARRATAELPTWRRAEILRGVAAGIAGQQESLAQTIRREAGKPIDFARGEAARAAETFAFAAEELRSARGEVIPLDASPRAGSKWGLTRRFPLGPVAAITPFNFPLNLVAHKLAPAIMAGCPIVLKPANKTPLSALALGELVLEAGWPPEALSVLNLAVSDAGPLIEDPRLRALSFTGSDAVGWALAGRAGRKRTLLELGGDAAVIVTPQVRDWEAMVRRIAFGAYAYAGQVCISVQRVYAHESVYERLVADLVREAQEGVRVGPPEESGVVMSGLIDDGAVAKVRGLVEQTCAAGARLRCGGHLEGRRFAPMVLTEVPADSPLARTEAFGPVAHVAPYHDLDEALALVDASPYGLQAGIYTSDLATATRAFERLEVGAVLVDEVPTFRVDHMPYGGVKGSGRGREGLRYAYEEHTETRLLVMPRG